MQLDLILDYFRKANHPRRFNRERRESFSQSRHLQCLQSHWMPGLFRFSKPFDSHSSSKPTTNNQTNNPGLTGAQAKCNRTSDSQKHLARQFSHVTQKVNGKDLEWKENKRTSLQPSEHSHEVCWVKPLDISEGEGIIYLSITVCLVSGFDIMNQAPLIRKRWEA